ncbi:ABC transporter substrate-binding protein [Microbacterium sp. NPDC055903]
MRATGGIRAAAASAVLVLVVVLAACAPALPDSVVPGTSITVGWAQELTSLNAAAAPTPGNVDIAETIRAGFGDMVDGAFIADEGFGTASIVEEEPFTARYDLAEPVWSDGIPLDGADLMLGWAGRAGYFATDEEGAPMERDTSAPVPVLDEFARSIDVTFTTPDIGWQQAVDVPVPAHVVGQRAFDIDDPMEAKQAVIAAIRDGDADALDAMTAVWNQAFAIEDPADIPAELLLSSGAYLIDEIAAGEEGQTVTLVPNTSYRGLVGAQVARIELVPAGADPVAAVGQLVDIAQVAPVAANRQAVRDLERQDFTVATTHDGTLWALMLRPSGVFTRVDARTAFLRSVLPSTLADGGGGSWASAYTATTSMLSAPGSRAYDIVNEDSGFARTLGTPAEDPVLDRERAGVGADRGICVLYDTTSEFASGAFAALRTAVAEAGWKIVDCGSDDVESAYAAGRGDAVIRQVAIPQTPEEIAAQWGTGGAASLTGQTDPQRDELIGQLAQTTDIYEARDVLASIEGTIVRAAVALPIAVNPRVTIVDRDVTGVTPRTGALASLTYAVVQWAAVP